MRVLDNQASNVSCHCDEYGCYYFRKSNTQIKKEFEEAYNKLSNRIDIKNFKGAFKSIQECNKERDAFAEGTPLSECILKVDLDSIRSHYGFFYNDEDRDIEEPNIIKYGEELDKLKKELLKKRWKWSLESTEVINSFFSTTTLNSCIEVMKRFKIKKSNLIEIKDDSCMSIDREGGFLQFGFFWREVKSGTARF